jgi:hypothetical protein
MINFSVLYIVHLHFCMELQDSKEELMLKESKNLKEIF